MQPKFFWTFDTETKIINSEPQEPYFFGGDYHYPDGALFNEPPAAKEGYVVKIKDDLTFEYVADHIGKIAYKIVDKSELEIQEFGDLPSGYTFLKPKEFDVWRDNQWCHCNRHQYERECSMIDLKRLSSYQERVDPLMNEAQIKRLQNNLSGAVELENLALAEREKIQKEYPWPPALRDA